VSGPSEPCSSAETRIRFVELGMEALHVLKMGSASALFSGLMLETRIRLLNQVIVVRVKNEKWNLYIGIIEPSHTRF
jgi:hypothetical protein